MANCDLYDESVEVNKTRIVKKYCILKHKNLVQRSIAFFNNTPSFEWVERQVTKEIDGISFTETCIFFDSKNDALEYIKANNIKNCAVAEHDIVLPPVRKGKGIKL